jgi:hypothetical protein
MVSFAFARELIVKELVRNALNRRLECRYKTTRHRVLPTLPNVAMPTVVIVHGGGSDQGAAVVNRFERRQTDFCADARSKTGNIRSARLRHPSKEATILSNRRRSGGC